VSILKKRDLKSLDVAKERSGNMKMLLAVVILGWALLPIPGQMARAVDKDILLLHTNSVKGHLFPCPT
jgi:hypothetical protein